MNPAAVRTVHVVDFGDRSARRPTRIPTGRIPRVARLLALAHRLDEQIRSGELRDLAVAARCLGLTRARVTQIANLLLLAPDIQEAILTAEPITKGRDPVSERSLRPIVAESEWERQIELWKETRR